MRAAFRRGKQTKKSREFARLVEGHQWGLALVHGDVPSENPYESRPTFQSTGIQFANFVVNSGHQTGEVYMGPKFYARVAMLHDKKCLCRMIRISKLCPSQVKSGVSPYRP